MQNTSGIPINPPPSYISQEQPKKYCKVNGIAKLNPAYTAWQRQQTQQQHGQTATSLKNPNAALPVISNMDDYLKYNEANVASGSAQRPLASLTDHALEKMQDPAFSKQVGLNSDQMVDGLQAILSKYEVPIGLTSKLLDLQQFDVLEFIIDDSGSMNNITDSFYPNGQV
jgi:hypothetical protein